MEEQAQQHRAYDYGKGEHVVQEVWAIDRLTNWIGRGNSAIPQHANRLNGEHGH